MLFKLKGCKRRGEQGCCSCESTSLPPRGPGSISGLGVMWVEFVVGTFPCSEKLF